MSSTRAEKIISFPESNPKPEVPIKVEIVSDDAFFANLTGDSNPGLLQTLLEKLRERSRTKQWDVTGEGRKFMQLAGSISQEFIYNPGTIPAGLRSSLSEIMSPTRMAVDNDYSQPAIERQAQFMLIDSNLQQNYVDMIAWCAATNKSELLNLIWEAGLEDSEELLTKVEARCRMELPAIRLAQLLLQNSKEGNAIRRLLETHTSNNNELVDLIDEHINTLLKISRYQAPVTHNTSIGNIESIKHDDEIRASAESNYLGGGGVYAGLMGGYENWANDGDQTGFIFYTSLADCLISLGWSSRMRPMVNILGDSISLEHYRTIEEYRKGSSIDEIKTISGGKYLYFNHTSTDVKEYTGRAQLLRKLLRQSMHTEKLAVVADNVTQSHPDYNQTMTLIDSEYPVCVWANLCIDFGIWNPVNLSDLEELEIITEGAA